MGATKEVKEKKLTPDESSKLILNYLRKTNRPYSATDISTNLNNKVTKAAATKLLKDMHERNEIDGKASGKQIVYFAIQDEVDENFEETMQAKEAETERLRTEIMSLKTEEKELRLALRAESTIVTTAELKSNAEKLEQEQVELQERLAKLKSGNVKPVDPERKAQIVAARKKWAKIVANRKKIRKELWGMILDATEKDQVAERKEEVGIEGDI
ncbi:hypothetical protein CKM354_001073000 [Cercospora kikuchii]|uniref:Homologous-pairing protein 2 winged helix domain-containing protein n=1 Tax=Cercospora kikuchii TaxID=84275 RepID=A0A9P3CVS7_9PEZI|nr:uncharacterized protein CKM354_001073000 [Cercospora kikuchii]GIZ47645.1 hypothetical protein CKM354_001073000 [Cercospora kikuchii]